MWAPRSSMDFLLIRAQLLFNLLTGNDDWPKMTFSNEMQSYLHMATLLLAMIWSLNKVFNVISSGLGLLSLASSNCSYVGSFKWDIPFTWRKACSKVDLNRTKDSNHNLYVTFFIILTTQTTKKNNNTKKCQTTSYSMEKFKQLLKVILASF